MVYMFSLRFSGSKFLINQLDLSAGFTSFHFVFKITISKMRNYIVGY